MITRLALFFLAALAGGCASAGNVGGGTAACTSDDACGPGGRCLAADWGGASYCALPDGACASGYRWSPTAPFGLRGECVDAGDGGGGGDMRRGDLAMTPSSDLAGSDLASPPSMDLAAAQDLAVPADLAPAGDLAMPIADLAGPRANTGEPCGKSLDCAGTKPSCFANMNGTTWPGGYCSAQCDPANTDPKTGLNRDCPGGHGICVGQNPGQCLTACTGMQGNDPCLRANYLCFSPGGCEPTGLSMCDPTKPGSCGASMTCVRVGDDNVGECTPACDPFKQNCAKLNNQPTACYASDDTGEGLCSNIYTPNGDGQACTFLNDCAAGLGCFQLNQNVGPVCRPFCGGPNNVACNNGKTCAGINGNVPKAVVGCCGA